MGESQLHGLEGKTALISTYTFSVQLGFRRGGLWFEQRFSRALDQTQASLWRQEWDLCMESWVV